MGLRKKKSLLDQASDYVESAVEQVKPQLESAMASAKDKAGPVIADAKAKAGPAVTSGAALAAEKIAIGAAAAAELAAEASQAAADKVADVAEPEKKGGKLKKLLLLTGLVAGIAFVAKKLQAGSAQADNWQSSYTPTPAPSPTAAPASPANDEGGSSPDEALADQAEAPHPVTTPDDPAEVVDVEKKDK